MQLQLLIIFTLIPHLGRHLCLAKSVIGIENEERWPVVDENGYYLAYQEDDRWFNWWRWRDRPGSLSFFGVIATARDESNVPSDKREIDAQIPVERPYWTNESSEANVGQPGVRATWIGHATVLAEVDSVVMITDPIFSDRASPVQWWGPKRYRKPACSVSELPNNLQAVLISHNHYDHLDYNSIHQLFQKYQNNLTWFVTSGLKKWFISNFGMDINNIKEMVWWQEEEVPGTGVKIVMTPSNHWSRRGYCDKNKSLWGSWAVIGPKSRFWFAGDTAYSDVFKQIGEKLGPFNLSAIPIGAFEPRWFMKYDHVNPSEAVQIHQDIQSQRSFGIHWGTFRMSYEPYLSPRERTLDVVQKAGLSEGEFEVVNPGQTVYGIERSEL